MPAEQELSAKSAKQIAWKRTQSEASLHRLPYYSLLWVDGNENTVLSGLVSKKLLNEELYDFFYFTKSTRGGGSRSSEGPVMMRQMFEGKIKFTEHCTS